ncbi:hypothetical protein CYMTET_16920 [Cymbomonas tetramitiformis]|uniref:PROP1-like PPR domain-containing protein n=1 Tax=Cymbomonas tetramitiformis TaxID=36881 RepID=A0AAE0GBA3_9CHLO|nr:hypothetical protein CYMTET_16920 [Cymbomonas tetramitiformis]
MTAVVIRHQGAVAKTRILMQADASGSDAPVSDSDEIVKVVRMKSGKGNVGNRRAPKRRNRGSKKSKHPPNTSLNLEDFTKDFDQMSDPRLLKRINGAIQNTKSLPVALKLVEDMSAASIPPNEQTYVSLILVCRKQRQAERALVVYEAMKAAGVQPSLKTYNLLLRCACQARRQEDALRIQAEMKEAGVKLNANTHTVLIEVALRCSPYRGRSPPSKRLGRMLALLDEMKAEGCQPIAATYNVLIEGAVAAGQIEVALAKYSEMAKQKLKPNQETFQMLMRGAGKSGRLNNALAVFGEMKAAGVSPNLDTYNQLIIACGNSQQPQVEKAFEIFYEMQAEGVVQANEMTFNALISAACKGGLPSFAFDAFDIMKNSGTKASLRTYNELLHAAGLRGVSGVESAFEVYDALRVAGEVPDNVTFSCLIAACARARDAERAMNVFHEMHEVGVEPNLVVYHALLAGLGRSGQWADALNIYHNQMVGNMTHDNQPTRATISILFDACLGEDGAEAALAQAVDSGDKSTFIDSEAVEAAKDLYKEVVYQGLLQSICPAQEDLGEEGMRTVRCDIRGHTRSATILGLLVLLDDLKSGYGEAGELVIMTGGKPRASGGGRPSKLLVTAQTTLNLMGLACKPLSTLTVQALVVEKASLAAWRSSGTETVIPESAPGIKSPAAASYDSAGDASTDLPPLAPEIRAKLEKLQLDADVNA